MAKFFYDYKGRKVATMMVFFEESYKYQLKHEIEKLKWYEEDNYPINGNCGNLYARTFDFIKSVKGRMIERMLEHGYSEAYAKTCTNKIVANVCKSVGYTMPRHLPTEKRF